MGDFDRSLVEKAPNQAGLLVHLCCDTGGVTTLVCSAFGGVSMWCSVPSTGKLAAAHAFVVSRGLLRSSPHAAASLLRNGWGAFAAVAFQDAVAAISCR